MASGCSNSFSSKEPELSIADSNRTDNSVLQEAKMRDILQQALDEVSPDYSMGAVLYDAEGKSISISNEVTLVPCDTVTTVESEVELSSLKTVNSERLASHNEGESLAEFGDDMLHPGSDQQFSFSAGTAIRTTSSGSVYLGHNQSGFEEQSVENIVSLNPEARKQTSEKSSHNVIMSKFTVPSVHSGITDAAEKVKLAPLGSSQNPIRIIQQGNKYKSLQNLTPEQLAQIMQVVQQQQLLRSAQQTGQASVLYNPQTQTKIIFRVVYPSELHKNVSRDIGTTLPKTSMSGVKTPVIIQRRGNLKRKHLEEGKGVNQELSRHEKELRKKRKHRTRYGRVSRPPQYMVKDYKHIHPVDYDDEYDDSDGGYSDFREGSSEEELVLQRNKSNMDDWQESVKPRKHKCNTCEKSYIGPGGLTRHYRLNPSHGSMINYAGADACNSSDSFQSFSTSVCGSQLQMVTSAGETVSTSFPVDSTSLGVPCDVNKKVSGVSLSNESSVLGCEGDQQPFSFDHDKSSPEQSDFFVVHKQQRRGKRGRPPSNQQARRRAERLQELIGQCTDKEIIEVAMPRICASVNLWEFLLMKTENKTAESDLNEMIEEFGHLRKQLASLLQARLVRSHSVSYQRKNKGIVENDVLVDEEQASPNLYGDPKQKPANSVIEISDDLALCLGMSGGCYEVKDSRPAHRYKVIASNPDLVHEDQRTVRTTELGPQEPQIALPLRKRLRLAEHAIVNSPSAELQNGCEYKWKDAPNHEHLPVTVLVKPKGNELSNKARDFDNSGTIASTEMTAEDDHVDSSIINQCGNERLTNLISLSQGSSYYSASPSCSTGYDVQVAAISANRNDCPAKELENSSFEIEFSGLDSRLSSCITVPRNNVQVSCAKTDHLLNRHQANDNNESSEVGTLNSSIVRDNYNGHLDESDSYSYVLSPLLTSTASTYHVSTNSFVSRELQSAYRCNALVQSSCFQSAIVSETSSNASCLFADNSNVEPEQKNAGLDTEKHDSLVNLQLVSGHLGETMTNAVESQHLGIQDPDMNEYHNIQQGIQFNENLQLIQTNDDVIVIRNPDGSIQIHGQPGQQISLETVQALLGFDHNGQMVFENMQQP